MYTELVKREKRTTIKTFLIIIAAIIAINFIIFILDGYASRWPYLINISVILLTIFVCGLVILKLFSNYSYTLTEEKLIFHRMIGKRAFEILSLDLKKLVYIEPYSEKKGFRPEYKFVFPREYEGIYIGKFMKDDRYCHFLFKPSKKMLNLIGERVKERSK